MNPSAQHPIVATIPSNDRDDHVVHAPKALADRATRSAPASPASSRAIRKNHRSEPMPELTWQGKYGANGGRVAPLRVALPFQTVETVNESAQDRQRSLDLFGAGQQQDWPNRLIWGDKKYVLAGLLEEFVGAVDLVYIDPPFATGQDFSLPIEVHDMEFT
jgi:hypothetical protein